MELLYQVEGLVNPTCSNSHITYSIFIDKSYDVLKVNFEYSPKELDSRVRSKELILESLAKYGYDENSNWEKYLPLMNHITLSFDDPESFRGATHRHDSNIELILSKEASSPGIISDANPPGLWKITLSVHSLITNDCRYRLKVWGGENE